MIFHGHKAIIFAMLKTRSSWQKSQITIEGQKREMVDTEYDNE